TARQTKQKLVCARDLVLGWCVKGRPREKSAGWGTGAERVAGESWMAERVENVGAPVNPVPLLPPRPMPPRPADLLPPRNGAPASPGTEEAAAGPGPLRTEPRHLLVGRGVSLSGEITTCERLTVEGNVEANLHECRDIDIAER